MIICATTQLQQQLLGWIAEPQACYDSLSELERALQAQLAETRQTVPILLDADCLSPTAELETQLARLHVLSGHKPILIGAAESFRKLAPAACDHVFALLPLPLSAGCLHMLKQQLQAEADRLRLLADHQQRLKQLMDENRRLRQRLSQESSLDPLTGLLHRRAFEERLDEEWRRAHRHGHPISGILLRFQDLAGDTPAGAGFLQDLARRLKAVRASDLAGRLDDHLFVVILPLTFLEGAQALSAHFRGLIARLTDERGLGLHAEVLCCTEIPRCHNDSSRFLTHLLSGCQGAPGKEALLI